MICSTIGIQSFIFMPGIPTIPPTAAFNWLSESIKKFADVMMWSPSLSPSTTSTQSPALTPSLTDRHSSLPPPWWIKISWRSPDSMTASRGTARRVSSGIYERHIRVHLGLELFTRILQFGS